MKQFIIRMFVALVMCGMASVLRFISFTVISGTIQLRTESIWTLRLILTSVLSPLLYGFLSKLTAGWGIRAKQTAATRNG